MTRAYELMVVFEPDTKVTDKTAMETVQKLVGDAAKVTEATFLGKKQLAYEIKKKNEGVYVVAKLTGNVKVGEIEKKTRLGIDVLRYLLTVV